MATEFPQSDADSPAEPDLLEEQLVAYLDGELDAAESRRIEQLLAGSDEVRQRLQGLERSWELLDQLDRAEVGDCFTRTTLEMVSLVATEDVRQSQALLPVRRRRRWLWGAAAVLAAGLAGFVAVALYWPDRNRRLLQDLPLLEDLDAYRRVESLKFLQTLADSQLFDQDRTTAEDD
jgi:hypothetical protein